MDTQLYIDKFVALLTAELKDNLIGIYLHGSLAMGCFHPKSSDIDLLVVIRKKLTADNNKRITSGVLSLHDEMPNERGMEFSIVLETSLNPFVYPTPLEYHYSDSHRDRYSNDESYVCGGMADKDLASQITVAYHRGYSVFGPSLHEVCEPVPRQYYLASILYDIEGASNAIISNPMYMTLNLCRVLFFLKEGNISSKKEGGEWGVQTLPRHYRAMIQQCLDEYTGSSGTKEFDNELLVEFADYMLAEIHTSST
jgi:streptomycin 3"-adenylyltransferase